MTSLPSEHSDSSNEPNSDWFQLFSSGSAVGYKKRVGRLDLYSRDGYAWSGKKQEYELAARQSSLRLNSGQRIFHGDIIAWSASSDDEGQLQLVIVDETGETHVGSQNSSQLVRATELQHGQRRPTAQKRVGSIFIHPHYRQVFDTPLHSYLEKDVRLGGTPLRLALALSLGVLLTALLQFYLNSGVDPLICLVGGFISTLVGSILEVRIFQAHLSRYFLLQVAPRAALYNGVIFSSAYALAALATVPGLPQQLGGQILGALAAFIFGYLLSFAIIAIGGNIVQHYRIGSPSN
ncbi:MAG: hypothetical protein MK135_05285 [Polyangiaceae bacterium]|nr:hypothetical protein [Polyangiaceae bacterium]